MSQPATSHRLLTRSTCGRARPPRTQPASGAPRNHWQRPLAPAHIPPRACARHRRAGCPAKPNQRCAAQPGASHRRTMRFSCAPRPPGRRAPGAAGCAPLRRPGGPCSPACASCSGAAAPRGSRSCTAPGSPPPRTAGWPRPPGARARARPDGQRRRRARVGRGRGGRCVGGPAYHSVSLVRAAEFRPLARQRAGGALAAAGRRASGVPRVHLRARCARPSAPGAWRGTAPSAWQTLGRPEAGTIPCDLCALQNRGRSPS